MTNGLEDKVPGNPFTKRVIAKCFASCLTQPIQLFTIEKKKQTNKQTEQNSWILVFPSLVRFVNFN